VFSSILNNAYRVTAIDTTDGLWCEVLLNATDAASVSNTYGWFSVQTGSSAIYDIDTTQTNPSALATNINALANNQWVTATYPTWSVGATPVAWASKDIYYFSAGGFANSGGTDLGILAGGEYFINSSVYGNTSPAPTAYTFESANFVANPYASVATPTTNEDWANETAYLVPTSLRTLKDYLSNLSICGISNSGNIDVSADNTKLNISTKTIGSAGSVRIAPSTANQASTNIVGYATTSLVGNSVSAYTNTFEIPTANASGFKVNQWVSLQNSQLVAGSLGDIDFDNTTVVIVSNPTPTTSNLNLSSGSGEWYSDFAVVTNKTWTIIKYGKYAAYVLDPSSSDNLGQPNSIYWMNYNNPTGPSSNNGYFQVLFSINTQAGTPQKNVIFVENPNAVEGVYNSSNTVTVRILDNVVLGSIISVQGGIMGPNNNGAYTVSQIVDNENIIVNGSLTPGTYAIGAGNYNSLFKIFTPKPVKFISKISYLQPSATDLGYTQVGIADRNLNLYISGSSTNGGAGTVMTALDKLAFSTTLNGGVDAYRVNTGLIAQCNKIVYGDPADTVTYPGILADGNNININGPVVTNISATMAIRIVQGIQTDVVPQVQNAVANLINTNPIGNPIALSSIIDVASNIPGVESVVMISPALTDSTDTISIQPYEKSIVTNINNIGVSVLFP